MKFKAWAFENRPHLSFCEQCGERLSSPEAAAQIELACPQCGAHNNPGVPLCTACSQPLPSVLCPSCGTQNKPASRFCSNCGRKLQATRNDSLRGLMPGAAPTPRRHRAVRRLLGVLRLVLVVLAATGCTLARSDVHSPTQLATLQNTALPTSSGSPSPSPTPIVQRACLRKYSDPETAVAIPDPGNLSQMSPGDFNGDGRTDFVLARWNPSPNDASPIGILLNNGDGGLLDGTSQLFAGSIPRTQNPREIVVADFNGDGRDDFFIADHGYDAPPFPGYPNTLVLSTPDGKMTDATGSLPQQAAFTHSAAAADVDGDGDVDLYVGDIPVGSEIPPQLLLNDGAGRFTDVSGRIPEPYRDVSRLSYTTSAFADVNNDGAPDLILGADGSSPQSVVLTNNSAGFFTSLSNAIPAKPWEPADIAVDLKALDVSGDGWVDLFIVFTKNDPFYQGRFVQVLINNGDGTFRDETSERLFQSDNLSPWLIWLDPVDLDGDGDTDLVGRANGAEKPLVYLNNGDGVFSPTGLAAQTFDSRFVLFFDLDGDGGRDILMSTSTFDSTPELHYLLQDPGCR